MPSSQFLFPEEPSENNILTILQDVYTRFNSVEQVRWSESNIDVRFWAGDQDYVYQYFTFAANHNFKSFYFNIIRQPVCMITGYQRQHRKSISVTPVEMASQHTADQFNKLLAYIKAVYTRLLRWCYYNRTLISKTTQSMECLILRFGNTTLLWLIPILEILQCPIAIGSGRRNSYQRKRQD